MNTHTHTHTNTHIHTRMHARTHAHKQHTHTPRAAQTHILGTDPEGQAHQGPKEERLTHTETHT